MKTLLIVSCSQRKRPDPNPLPAIERYDGPTYQVLRKARREGYWPAGLEVLILSAEFGLLKAESPILNYDRRMTESRVAELKPAINQALTGRLAGYHEIFVNLGQVYLKALPDMPAGTSYAVGSIGQRSAQMKDWLLRINQYHQLLKTIDQSITDLQALANILAGKEPETEMVVHIANTLEKALNGERNLSTTPDTMSGVSGGLEIYE